MLVVCVCVCVWERERERERERLFVTNWTVKSKHQLRPERWLQQFATINYTTQLVCFWQTQCVFSVKNTAITKQFCARACTAATPATISHQLPFLILRHVTDLICKYTRQPNENIHSDKNTGRIRLPNHLRWHIIKEDRLKPSSKTSLRTLLPNQLPWAYN